MIIKCKKQFIALFMALSVIFCVGSESYIKAEALEWAIPTITAGEALKWLLGLLGVTVAGGALANTDWDNLVEQYNDYAEIKGQTAVDTGKFWSDIIDGTLDQGSQAWSNFKEWVTSLNFGNTSSFPLVVEPLNNIVSTLPVNSVPYTYTPKSLVNELVSTKFAVYAIDSSGKLDYVYIYDGIDSINFTTIPSSTGSTLKVDVTWVNNSGANYMKDDVNHNYFRKNTFSNISSSTWTFTSNTSLNFYFYGVASEFFTGANMHSWDLALPDSTFQAYNTSLIDSLSLILTNAISDAIPDVIPLPWDQVSDTAEGINEKIDDLIEKVNTGVLSLEEYMIAIQSILGVIAFDTTTDLVIPTDPDLPDKTIQDKVNENVTNNGFVLTGLENFFPFCIPFDIYSFITILVADPVAPVIHWHIYNPVSKTDNIMTLDFAIWEPVVILFRYIFDFLFIIGLALIARSLIGGED